MQQIAVGIHPDSSYSAQVLDQLGIPSVPVESLEEGIAQGVRVFLWNTPEIMPKVAPFKERLAIITNHGCLNGTHHAVQETPAKSYYFTMPDSCFRARSFFAELPVLRNWAGTTGVCYDLDNNPIPGSGICVIEEPQRLVISLPWDIRSYVQGAEWRHRPYFSRATGKHFVEVGPILDTGAFRRLLLEMLVYCFDWLELPLVRVSPFYRNKKWFSFRIDADGFTESSTEAALRIAEKTGLRFTWFIDVASWRHQKQWIARLIESNQDVQFHCFRHMTYVSREVNRINIRKGLRVLRHNGVTPSAIVSPFGYNYSGFSECIREYGFVYSSEFGYAVDDLPSHPNNDRNYPLQIPVHPGCSGVFREAGFTEQEQFDHLFDRVQRRCDLDGICILYDHPIGGMEVHESDFISLFDRLRNTGYDYVSMSDYYRAWVGRPNSPAIQYRCGAIEVDGYRGKDFQIEQVTNGSMRSVLWESTTLPQVSLPKRTDEFRYPPGWIQRLVCQKMGLHLKQRDFSKFAWHVNEACDLLGRKTGYSHCRRLLGRVNWLHAIYRALTRTIYRKSEDEIAGIPCIGSSKGNDESSNIVR